VYDLRNARSLRAPDGTPIDYDINLCLRDGRDISAPAAIVTAPEEDLQLQLWTDQPGVQFYDGVWTDVSVPGLGGRKYAKHSGLCLEDQAWPDAVHHANFPSIIYGPNRDYQHRCEIEIAP